MLVDVEVKHDEMCDIIARVNSGNSNVIHHQTGIYEFGGGNFEYMIGVREFEKQYPKLGNFDCYGVCDNYQQILKKCKELKNPNRNFVISLMPIEKKTQPEDGGWRWHKWGPYIGKQKPTHEYIYDEPKIEKVYCYHIYEL